MENSSIVGIIQIPARINEPHSAHLCVPVFELCRLYPGGGVLPYMGCIGMCGPKGYGFLAVLVINRVSIIAILRPLWS